MCTVEYDDSATAGGVPPLPPLPTLPPVDGNEDAPPPFDPLPFDLTGIEGIHKGITRIEFVQHAQAFDGFLFPTMEKMPQSKRMPTKVKYKRILGALTLLRNGESLTNLRRAGHKQIHYWHKKYAIVVSGEIDESRILVLSSIWSNSSCWDNRPSHHERTDGNACDGGRIK